MQEGEDRLGETVGGRYVLRGVLGQGGQSVIYRAKDEIDGDEVAVKILKRNDADAVERLFREARALLSLAGTAALRVLHQTKTDDGAACLVTELLRGKTLDEHLSDVEAGGEKLALADLREIFGPIVATLEMAHARGIVHRDIKPENIFLVHPAYGGGVRLLDFGFTRFLHGRSLTQPGMVAGSPMYISPEAWAGKEVDQRADIYALAVILYRVLAGAPPFSGRIQELLRTVRTAPRPSLHAVRPDLSSEIDEWVKGALAVEPDERFQRAQACWTAFELCLSAPT